MVGVGATDEAVIIGRRHPVRVMRAPQRMTRIARVERADVLMVFGLTGDLAKCLTGQGAWHEGWVAA